uniref:Uncharacterized protein n=1 Tax=Rhizophagus irregularis (strain DAOM 181602 / DAOM 197198 / MUCL 43194) TaxID=747089 RepID=U9TSR9_RHIID
MHKNIMRRFMRNNNDNMDVKTIVLIIGVPSHMSHDKIEPEYLKDRHIRQSAKCDLAVCIYCTGAMFDKWHDVFMCSRHNKQYIQENKRKKLFTRFFLMNIILESYVV